MSKIELVIFDLDGVLVDTAKYHYLAWKKLGKEKLCIDFTEEQNEAFKGVSRLACMDIMCTLSNKEDMPNDERVKIANEKNDVYLDLIKQIDQSELLTGVLQMLKTLKENKIKIGLGSASKNAVFILEKTQIIDYFDVIIDGTKVTKAKPDPEVFTLCAKTLSIKPENCVVFEDAIAGIEAAIAANMKHIGIGIKENLPNAKLLYNNVGEVSLDTMQTL